MHTSNVTIVLDKHAYTLAPYKKMFNIELFPKIAAAPIIKIPVPKKKLDAIEIPKYLLNITFKNVYKLAQPKLIIIFDNIHIIYEQRRKYPMRLFPLFVLMWRYHGYKII